VANASVSAVFNHRWEGALWTTPTRGLLLIVLIVDQVIAPT